MHILSMVVQAPSMGSVSRAVSQPATVMTTRALAAGSTQPSRALSSRSSDHATNGDATRIESGQASTCARPEKTRLVTVVLAASFVE